VIPIAELMADHTRYVFNMSTRIMYISQNNGPSCREGRGGVQAPARANKKPAG